MKNLVQLGAKLTLSDRTEEFVRFIAARTGDIIFSEAGFSGMELQQQVRTFVNRVHGNYVSSQRPVAFQGPTWTSNRPLSDLSIQLNATGFPSCGK